MRIRITIEYELSSPEDYPKEQLAWIDGNVSFQDIWYLFNEGDEGYKVLFNTVD